jgi:hypothetical protein
LKHLMQETEPAGDWSYDARRVKGRALTRDWGQVRA